MTDAIWKNPSAFWLLWVIPVLVLLAIYAHRKVVHAARLFAGEVMMPRIMPRPHT